MKVRIVSFASAVALLVSVAAPSLAHEEHPEHDEGKQEQGWPGSSLAQEVARAMLADSQGTVDAAAQSSTPCTDGLAGEYPCSNVDLMAFMPLAEIGGGKANDIWGWTDPLTGREYALLGRTSGTSFVDITDPTAPVYLGNLPTTRFNSTWRDLKVYGNHVFVVSEARNHGMQVFDLTRLRNVSSPPVTFSADAVYRAFATAHNIAINEQSGFAYAVGTDTCSGGLHIVDIRSPLSPTQAGCFSADGYTHDVQCVNYAGPDSAFHGHEICFASNEDSLTIVDVSNKTSPVELAKIGYTGFGYTHQGWLTDDQAYFVADDELDEDKYGHNTHTYVFDVSNLRSAAFVGTSVGTTKAIDHNQYIVGNHTYQSNYRGGLRILELTDLAAATLTEVAYFDTYPADTLTEFNGSWSNYPFFGSGNVIVSDIERGLFVVRPNLGPSDSPPAVQLDTPIDGATVSGVVEVAATATDDSAVTQVEFFVDGGSIATDASGSDGWSFAWDTAPAADGTYTLTAVATDDASQTSTSAFVGVTVDNVNDAPVAGFTSDCTGLSCTFTSTSSDDRGLTAWAWDFGDGATASGESAVHTYATDGTYAVTLTVTDTNGLSDTASEPVTVAGTVLAAHVGDLDGAAVLKGKSGRWEASVTVQVHDADDVPIAGATVTGSWTGSASGSVSGTTGTDGRVTFVTGALTGSSVSFSVTTVDASGLDYNSGANHDDDGDSTGTSITLSKPS